jgi:hypothetical protein
MWPSGDRLSNYFAVLLEHLFGQGRLLRRGAHSSVFD